MKRVCFVNNGENLDKIGFKLNIDTKDKVISAHKLFEYKYFIINEGNDDIIIIDNYKPCFIKKIDDRVSVLDIYSLGYDVIGDLGEVVVIQEPNGIKYTVKPLDTLDKISQLFGTNKNDIIENNSLKSEKLFIGQILII